ncbi:MAG TPA: alpha-hydroxy acid oxidase [Terriglobales bacterium]|nr:alpha-hydroxy acid oxidase [Terriglobales bacterium]
MIVNFRDAITIEDLRRMANRRLPKVVFDYLDGGAEDEVTLRANSEAFSSITFRPRNGVAFDECDLRSSVLGFNLALPAVLAPIGYSRMMHSGGEVAAASAAGAAGTAYILSTISGHRLEDVKTASNGPVWYQLYLLGGRKAAEPTLERARNAGFSALVVTIDTAVAGLRERDYRNGVKALMGKSVLAKIPHLSQLIVRPGWTTSFLLDGGLRPLPNVIVPGNRPMGLQDVASALASSTVTWEDFRWIRETWKGPIVVKGVLTGEDARRAVDVGAAAVVVSNHGGRQLDQVSPTLRALSEVVEAVEKDVEVLMDGGIRRGSDIVKALCLGARAVLIGRAYAYGLAAAGRSGVARALEILKSDMERTLRLLGCPSVKNLDRSYIDVALMRG